MSSDPILHTTLASESSASQRVFPPLYVSKGDPNVDRLAFIHILQRLKTQKRTGWLVHQIPHPESISDHMYRMALMAMFHDLAEAQVGDIAPHEGIPKQEKRRLEAEAMHNFVHEMLHYSPAAQKIEALWNEYEDGQSAEARFVKDLDRLEMAAQASEYEAAHGASTLQPFFDSSVPYIQHAEVKEWAGALMAERESSAQ